LRAKLREDAFDAAGADHETALPQFLRDDLGRGIRVEEAVADNLLDDLIGAAVVGLGPAFLIEQGESAVALKGDAQLEVTLPAEAELGGGRAGAQSFTLSFEEHGELGEDDIGRGRAQRAAGTYEGEGVRSEYKHRWNAGRPRGQV